MARTMDSAKRILNGVWGEVWIDGEKIAECVKDDATVENIEAMIKAHI